MEMTVNDVTKRMAHKVWEIFEKEEIPNTESGNYQAAEGIIKRIINGSYNIDEFRNLLNAEDYEYIRRVKDDYKTRYAEDSSCIE
jgi:hypothetical protein